MPERIEITRDTPLQVGDEIEIHFKTLSLVWIKAAHIAAIEFAIKKEGHFDIIHSQYTYIYIRVCQYLTVFILRLFVFIRILRGR